MAVGKLGARGGTGSLGVLGTVSTLASLFRPGDAGFLYYPMSPAYLFQDTAGTTPVASDGDQVARDNDRSGLGNNATQATGTKRAFWHPNSGKPYIQFDGVDDLLGTSVNPTSALSMCVATRVTASGADQYVMGGGETAAVARGYLGVQGGTNFARLVWGSTTLLGAADVTGADHVLIGSGNASVANLWVDGTKVATATPTGAPGGTLGPIAIGGINPNGTPSAWANCRAYGVLSISRMLSDSEIAFVTSTFRSLYQ